LITVHNLSKIYPLYAQPSDRLKQSLWYALPSFLRRPRQFYQEFWALRDVSFEIRRGETVGIIGRNGSGKSTLLQIIAGTLSPSHGEVEVQGQVAALLELGSGFNPEFTGRENVYMNGSILGLSTAEINGIYDQIVTFADIGPFINQPVKFYSSGMFVRLAFAVQVFVPKEILIVDEALSVGDSAFQRKCMVQLDRFRDDGGTVLLVSHDGQTIVRQCERCILLSQGELILDGASKFVTDMYQKIMYSPPNQVADLFKSLQHSTTQTSQISPQTSQVFETYEVSPSDHAWFDPHMPQLLPTIYSNGHAEIRHWGLYHENGQRVNVLLMGQRYEWQYQVEFYQTAHEVTFGMMIKTVDGIDVAGVVTNRENLYFPTIAAPVIMQARFSLKINLAPGTYFLNAGVMGLVGGDLTYLQRRVDIEMFRVVPTDTRQPYGLAYLEPEVTVTKCD